MPSNNQSRTHRSASAPQHPAQHHRTDDISEAQRKTACASPPSRTTPASRRPHPQRTLHKDRTGGDPFLLPISQSELSVFIYLFLGLGKCRKVINKNGTQPVLFPNTTQPGCFSPTNRKANQRPAQRRSIGSSEDLQEESRLRKPSNAAWCTTTLISLRNRRRARVQPGKIVYHEWFSVHQAARTP